MTAYRTNTTLPAKKLASIDNYNKDNDEAIAIINNRLTKEEI